MGPLVMRLLWLPVGRVSRICWEKKITEEKNYWYSKTQYKWGPVHLKKNLGDKT